MTWLWLVTNGERLVVRDAETGDDVTRAVPDTPQ
jgi:polyhydroxyalkanoate synthesis regulator protein